MLFVSAFTRQCHHGDHSPRDFVCNVDNKDFMWLKEIEEEAERMFIR